MSRRLALALLLGPILWPSQATAGTYDVYSCRLPDGSVAPAKGWQAASNAGGQDPFGAVNRCATGDGLTAVFPIGVSSAGSEWSWAFTAAAGTTVESFLIHRVAASSWDSADQSSIAYVSSYGAWPMSLEDGDEGESCIPPGSSSGRPPCLTLGSASQTDPADVYARSGVHASWLKFAVRCLGPGSQCRADDPYTLSGFKMFDARLTLDDVHAPAFERDLSTTPGEFSDIAVPLSVSDEGSGIAELDVTIDGNPVAREDGATVSSSCRAPFTDPAPCPARRDVALQVQTARLADGPHELRALAIDASGNRTLSAPLTLTTRNGTLVESLAPPAIPQVAAPNGRGASRFARITSRFSGSSALTSRTLAYGRATSVAGRLTNASSQPIADAVVTVDERLLAAGSGAKALPQVRTDGDGRFSYRVAPGPSRIIRFSYSEFQTDPAPVAVGQVTVHVRAGVSLRVSPTRVRNGTTIAFSGRVLGQQGTRRPIVTIYAVVGGPRPRVPVETVRARADGRFSYRYRFRSITGPAVYRFEARVPQQTAFPYAEGASRPVVVRGRP
jgi:hypothetical protein